MKKAYITPKAEVLDIMSEGFMCASSAYDKNEGTAEQWSQHKGGWDSSDWSGNSDESEE